jgi:glutamate 5-kinase
LRPASYGWKKAKPPAAAGQVRLAEAYADMLATRGIVAAQVLLTFGDTEERRRYLNARATLGTLVALGAVPVINENDTVATAEIKFGDNDRLAARVASMMGADRLILLSDVDGLYTADPSRDPSAKHIGEVTAVTPEIEAMGGAVRCPAWGRGGMSSKLSAAKIAMGGGLRHDPGQRAKVLNPLTAITKGRSPHHLSRFADTRRGAQALDRGCASARRRAGD